MKALQDALGRSPQLRGNSCTEVRDTRCPDGCMCDSCRRRDVGVSGCSAPLITLSCNVNDSLNQGPTIIIYRYTMHMYKHMCIIVVSFKPFQYSTFMLWEFHTSIPYILIIILTIFKHSSVALGTLSVVYTSLFSISLTFFIILKTSHSLPLRPFPSKHRSFHPHGCEYSGSRE